MSEKPPTSDENRQSDKGENKPSYENAFHALGHGHDIVLDAVDELDENQLDELRSIYGGFKEKLDFTMSREDELDNIHVAAALLYKEMLAIGATSEEAVKAIYEWYMNGNLDTRISKRF